MRHPAHIASKLPQTVGSCDQARSVQGVDTRDDNIPPPRGTRGAREGGGPLGRLSETASQVVSSQAANWLVHEERGAKAGYAGPSFYSSSPCPVGNGKFPLSLEQESSLELTSRASLHLGETERSFKLHKPLYVVSGEKGLGSKLFPGTRKGTRDWFTDQTEGKNVQH